MKILLVRHGYDDFDANDSSQGRGQMIIAADVMHGNNLANSNTRIIASEHKRTMASAQVLADQLGVAGVEEVTWLTDGTEEDSCRELLAYAKIYKDGNVIAVTHLPEIEKILAELEPDYLVDVDSDVGYSDTYIIDTGKKTVTKMDIL